MKRPALLVALVVLTSATPHFAAGQTAAPVRVAALPVDVGALSYFAQEQGFFKKHGLDVQIVTGANGAAIAAAVAGGSMDIGDGNITTLALAHERGVPFVMVAPSGAYSSKAPTAALLVLRNSAIKSAKDLTGKIVAVSAARDISEVAVRAWMDKNGAGSDSLRFAEMPFSQMGSALAAGRVDAVLAQEPAMSGILDNDGRVLAHVYDTIAPEWIQGGYFCTSDYAKTHPDVVQKFADAMAEAAVWANANHAATAAMLEAFAKTTIPPGVQRMFYPERLRASELQPMIDASVKYGVLKAAFPAKDMFAPGIGR